MLAFSRFPLKITITYFSMMGKYPEDFFLNVKKAKINK